MKREELHRAIDDWLDSCGFREKENIQMAYGAISIQINFEDGKEVITIRERETVKRLKRAG